MNKKTKKKTTLKPQNILLILGIIYTLVTILAVITYVSSVNKISSTPITFSSVLGAMWWQIIMIVMFAVTYVVYSKKISLASLIEIVMGIAMLVYMIISIAIIGANLFAIIIELIYPLILVFHGLKTFKESAKQTKKQTE